MGVLLDIVKHLKPIEKKRVITPSDAAIEQQRLSGAARDLQWAYYNPPSDFRTLMSTYLSNAWVYSAVYLIASTASSVPFALYTRKTKQAAAQDHFLQDVFIQPNEYMTFTDLLESTFICLELVGNAFWEVVYNEYGMIRKIFFLNPANMRILPDEQTFVRGYEYVLGNKIIRYEPGEIVHFKYANPMNEYWGMGSIQSIWDQIVLDTYAKDYNARFFLNDATPSGVISTPRPLTDVAFNNLQSRWDRRHEGYKKAFKMAVLDDGMKFDPVATSPRDASFIEMRKIVRDALYVGTGVPPVLAGVPDVANYSTARVAQSIFYDSTIAPKLRKVGDTIDMQIVKPQDSYLMGAFDTSVAPINIIKLSANSRIVERLVKAKLVTMDEARALLGLPPLRQAANDISPATNADLGLSPADASTGEADSGESSGYSGDEADGSSGGGGPTPNYTGPQAPSSSTPPQATSQSLFKGRKAKRRKE